MPEPTPSVHVRDADPDDAPLIAEFNARLALETEDKRLDPTTVRAGVETTLARPELGRYFIAEADDDVVVSGDCVFRALQLSERDAFVDESLGNLF